MSWKLGVCHESSSDHRKWEKMRYGFFWLSLGTYKFCRKLQNLGQIWGINTLTKLLWKKLKYVMVVLKASYFLSHKESSLNFSVGKLCVRDYSSPQHYKIILSHDLWHSAISLAFQSILIFPPIFLLVGVC